MRSGSKWWSEVTIVAIFKDEAPYIREWLEFHRAVGVGSFLLYDDSSSDRWQEEIASSDAGRSVRVLPAGGRDQRTVYNDALKRLRRRARWVAFIDLDEFIWSPVCQRLGDALKPFRGFPSVFVQWILFGPGPHLKTPSDQRVLTNYGWCLPLSRADEDDWVSRRKLVETYRPISGQASLGKSVVNPRLVTRMGLHLPKKARRTPLVVDENFEAPGPDGWAGVRTASKLRINHYWSKSQEELKRKVLKGRPIGDRKKGTEEDVAAWLNRAQELNVEEDWSILSRIKPSDGVPRSYLDQGEPR